MSETHIRETSEGIFDRPYERAAKWLLARGVHPNHFTLLQVPVYTLQLIAMRQGWRWTFILLTLFVIALDGGDGILARVGKLQSKTGAVLDALFDTIGIVIVLVGSAQFRPEWASWIYALLIGNFVLLVQNAILEQKAIAYLRGPVLAGVGIHEVMPGGLVVASVILAYLILSRLPETARKVSFKALG